MKTLEKLICYSNNITDDGLESICNLTNLQEISVQDCDLITIKGVMRCFSRLTRLKRITIGSAASDWEDSREEFTKFCECRNIMIN